MTEREALKLALDWIGSAPHGDNCFLHDDGEYNRCFCGKDSLQNFINEVLAQPEQEPVGQVINERGEVDWISFVPPDGTNLYTTPPQRTWVGLTDEEEFELDQKYGHDFNLYIDQRDMKLKEKNL